MIPLARRVLPRSPKIQISLCAGLAFGLVIALHFDAFTGQKFVPYDAQTDYYPWYVNSLVSFREDVFLTLNPFKLGGMVNFHLLAAYDPIYWIPLLTGGNPGLYEHQLLNLSHFLLIPVALIMIARLYGVHGLRLVGIALVSVVAAYVGPTLALLQHSDTVDTFSWGFLAIAFFEYFRRRGSLAYAILFVLSLAFALIRHAQGAVFWPLFFAPYLLLHWREIAAHKHGLRNLLIAVFVGLVSFAPSLIEMAHMWSSIDATIDMQINNPLTWRDVFFVFGFPVGGISIIAIPTIVLLLAGVAIWRLPRKLGVFYVLIVGALLLYAFGQFTPFGDIFRKLYPPAALFRRPYAALYVVLPILFSLIVWQLSQKPLRLSTRFAAGATLVLGLATAFTAVNYPAQWVEISVVSACTAFVLWRSDKTVLVALGLVVQWAILCYAPVANSHWFPQPPNTPDVGRIEFYADLTPYLAMRSHRSEPIFRVVSIGLQASFGAYAGVFEYYNLAPDYSTRFPRSLIESGIEKPHAADLVPYTLAHPGFIGSDKMKELGVRYYIFAPEIYAKLKPVIMSQSSSLVEINSVSYWKIVQDNDYHPFVANLDQSARLLSPISAAVESGSVAFTIPDDSSFVDLGFVYDSWWNLKDEDGSDLSHLIADDGGQLRLVTSSIRGRSVVLYYGSRAFGMSVVLTLLSYSALALWGFYSIFSFLVARSRRASHPPLAPQMEAPSR